MRKTVADVLLDVVLETRGRTHLDWLYHQLGWRYFMFRCINMEIPQCITNAAVLFSKEYDTWSIGQLKVILGKGLYDGEVTPHAWNQIDAGPEPVDRGDDSARLDAQPQSYEEWAEANGVHLR